MASRPPDRFDGTFVAHDADGRLYTIHRWTKYERAGGRWVPGRVVLETDAGEVVYDRRAGRYEIADTGIIVSADTTSAP